MESNSEAIDQITAEMLKTPPVQERIKSLFEETRLTTAVSLSQYLPSILENVIDDSRGFVEANEFVEINVGGYKERVPLLIKSQGKEKRGFVYLITDGTAVKIGQAVNVQKRIDGIQVGNPRKIVLLQVIETDDMDRVEQSLHWWYRGYRTNGEWFYLLPLFCLDPSDCIERALGAESVRFHQSISINFSTNRNSTDVVKFWIKDQEVQDTASGNYVKHGY